MTTPGETRRAFLKKSAAATAMFAVADFAVLAAGATNTVSISAKPNASSTLPWYRRTLRWGQTNITEIDPHRYDIAWWRQQWKRTADPGRHHQRRRHRRLLSEQIPAALSRRRTLATAICSANWPAPRMRTAWPCWRAWIRTARTRIFITRIRTGSPWMPTAQPYQDTELYVTCVNSPYYDEYSRTFCAKSSSAPIPRVSPTTVGAAWIATASAIAKTAQRKFRDRTGQPIPRAKNWDDPVYRAMDSMELRAPDSKSGT